MTTHVEQTSTETSRAPVAATGGKELQTSQGVTTIADTVVQKIAAVATRDVSGVYDLGGGSGTARAFSAIRERIPGSSSVSDKGVSVEVGERQAAIDLDIVVEFGATIPELSNAVRRNVISSVERMTGLEVTEVNVTVNDVYLPSDDKPDEPPGPVTDLSAPPTPEATGAGAGRPAIETTDSATPDIAELIAAAVSACGGVASPSGGRFGEVVTYLPGRRVTGVRITADAVEVHVVAKWGVLLPEVAEEIRAACFPQAGGRRIDVVIDDVELP